MPPHAPGQRRSGSAPGDGGAGASQPLASWLLRRAWARRTIRWPLIALAVVAPVARALPDFAEVRVTLFWGLHVAIAAAGVAIGRLLFVPAGGGALVAQARWTPLAWWLRLLALAMLVALAWLAGGWLALGYELAHPAARLFLGASVLVMLGGFAAGTLLPRHPVAATVAPLALWVVFYLFAEAAPETARAAGGQVAFAACVSAVALGVSFVALNRRLAS